MNQRGLALDAWIYLIPVDDVYATCPCGCGQKWKFAVKNYADHESAFIERRLNEQD